MQAALTGLALLLAGCGERPALEPFVPSDPGAADTSAQNPAATPVPAATPLADAPAALLGEWRVAGIDGKPLGANFGIAISIDRSRISFEPSCAGFVWDYRYDAGTLTTARAPGYGATRQANGSFMVCAVAVVPELRQLGQALDAATRAVRTPANGIEFSGGGRSVMLFSQ